MKRAKKSAQTAKGQTAKERVLVAFAEFTMPTGLLVGGMPTPEYARLEVELQELAAGISD
ncbi:MAG TPA: hypothetical protein VHZ81_09630 [Galbitalea sp.]|jgi:hypothetical protein|nr:hypothetical protein [Galbitalea sp.]